MNCSGNFNGLEPRPLIRKYALEFIIFITHLIFVKLCIIN